MNGNSCDDPQKLMMVTGASGFLGRNLVRYFQTTYQVYGICHTQDLKLPGISICRLDLTQPRPTIDLFRKVRPDVVIHCAGLTDLDACEKNPEMARQLHVGATRNIVEGISRQQTKLVYISTDAVYAGVEGEFVEETPARPCNIYGKTKYEGELEALQREDSLVLRTNFFGWGHGRQKKGLAEWIYESLDSHTTIKGFTDAIFSPLYIPTLAGVIDRCLQKYLTGVYNCGSSNSCSKYEFAKKIAELAGRDASLVRPVPMDDFGFLARRGKNLSMSTGRLASALEERMENIDEGIRKLLDDAARKYTEPGDKTARGLVHKRGRSCRS